MLFREIKVLQERRRRGCRASVTLRMIWGGVDGAGILQPIKHLYFFSSIFLPVFFQCWLCLAGAAETAGRA